MKSDRAPSMTVLRRAAVIAAIALAAATGCGGSGSGSLPGVRSQPVTMALDAAAPDAGSDALLQLDGAIGNANAGPRLRLDESTLVRLGLTTVRLYEPFEKREMSFKAIPLKNLVALAGVDAGTEILHAAALNDYTVDLPLEVVTSSGAYLALRNGDGSPIAIEHGGPIRVVFTDRSEGSGVPDHWIWSLSTMTAR